MCKWLGLLDWATQIMPEGYAGAGLMLAIGLSMTPAFFIWSQFNRYTEKKLNIKGKYYEDDYYNQDKNQKGRD